MWRLTAFLAKQPTTSTDDFIDLINQRWAPAIVEADSQQNLIQRLIIYLPKDLSGTPIESLFPATFDILVEIWFDSFDHAMSAIEHFDSATQTIQPAALMNQQVSIGFLGEVLPKKMNSADETGVRMTVAGNVIDGMSITHAQKYWSENHPVVAQTAPQTWNRLTLYRQVHGHQIDGSLLNSWICPYQFYPMCADMGAKDLDELLKAYDNDEYMSIVRPDEKKFSKPEDMLTFVTDRRRVILDRSNAH